MNISELEFFIRDNQLIVYLVIFLGMLIEGEGIILFASVFAWQGLISWPLLALCAMTGTICGDVLWYAAGIQLRDTRFGNWLDRRYEKTGHWVKENIVSRYPTYAVISKFMYFTTRPTIFLAGWHKLEFKKFCRATLYATVIWGVIILGIGYFFGYTVHLIGFQNIMHRVGFFALGLFAGVFIIEFILKRFFFNKKSRHG